jgi:hypothetical protein
LKISTIPKPSVKTDLGIFLTSKHLPTMGEGSLKINKGRGGPQTQKSTVVAKPINRIEQPTLPSPISNKETWSEVL